MNYTQVKDKAIALADAVGVRALRALLRRYNVGTVALLRAEDYRSFVGSADRLLLTAKRNNTRRHPAYKELMRAFEAWNEAGAKSPDFAALRRRFNVEAFADMPAEKLPEVTRLVNNFIDVQKFRAKFAAGKWVATGTPTRNAIADACFGRHPGVDAKPHPSVQPWSRGPIFPAVISRVEHHVGVWGQDIYQVQWELSYPGMEPQRYNTYDDAEQQARGLNKAEALKEAYRAAFPEVLRVCLPTPDWRVAYGGEPRPAPQQEIDTLRRRLDEANRMLSASRMECDSACKSAAVAKEELAAVKDDLFRARRSAHVHQSEARRLDEALGKVEGERDRLRGKLSAAHKFIGKLPGTPESLAAYRATYE